MQGVERFGNIFKNATEIKHDSISAVTYNAVRSVNGPLLVLAQRIVA